MAVASASAMSAVLSPSSTVYSASAEPITTFQTSPSSTTPSRTATTFVGVLASEVSAEADGSTARVGAIAPPARLTITSALPSTDAV